MLYFQGYPLLVIDNDEGMLQSLRDRQIPYLFGDASSQIVLEKAHLHQAKAMAIALPDAMATRLTLKRALSLAPDLDITVRAHSTNEIDVLYQLGAQEVVQPEFEAALEIGAHLLLNLGDPTYSVQQVVNRYRTRRYRDILPEREEYWGTTDFSTTLAGLQQQWYTLPAHSPLQNQSLAQANIRRLTGVTVMAIDRQQQMYRYPSGETRLEVGDRLLVVGSSAEQDAFANLLQMRE
jgi:CPA2 family monovalent cation:H+ antiporter-2